MTLSSIRRPLLVAAAATALVCTTEVAASASPTRPGTPSGKVASSNQLQAVSTSPATAAKVATAKAAGWGHISWSSATSGATTRVPNKATAAWHCDLYVGPVTLPNGTDGDLKAETLVNCSGAFGIQQTRAHFDRSSGSGYRLYANTSTGPATRNTFQDTLYAVSCGGSGLGTYDYRLVAQGYTTAGGWTSGSAVYGGSAKQRFACGT